MRLALGYADPSDPNELRQPAMNLPHFSHAFSRLGWVGLGRYLCYGGLGRCYPWCLKFGRGVFESPVWCGV